GRALVVLVKGAEVDHCLVLRATGALIHHVDVPKVERWAVAEEQGHAFAIGVDGKLSRIDLRYGRIIETVAPPIEVRELAVDCDSRHLVLAGNQGSANDILHVVVSGLFRGRTEASDPPEATPTEPVRAITDRDDAATGEVPIVEAAERTVVVEIPRLPPLALGPLPLERPSLEAAESPYESAREHLDALLDVVSSRTALAIADAWNSGRLSPSNATARPHEIEVSALLGGSGGFAPDQLAEIKLRVETRQREASQRAHATAARGIPLPFPDLAREVGFSAIGAQVLLVVAAPALRGEITRLYGVLSNDPHRPVVDRYLVEQIVAGGRSVLRDQIARELAPDAPLVRHGLVQVDHAASSSLFARLTVPDALLERLRGLTLARSDDVSSVRTADDHLEGLLIADAVKRDVVLALAEARPSTDPLRLVLRGRRGSGRHTLIATMARQVGRELIAIDTSRMPRAPKDLAAALRIALFRASVHGVVPVVSGLEQVNLADADLREMLQQVLRAHPAAIIVRTTPEGTLPLDPGFTSITLPPLSETERAGAWLALLGTAGLRADVDALAARYRIGPGVIKRVIERVAGRSELPADVTALLDEQIRQHVATRLDHVANRVGRLAGWEDVALPDEMLDSLREFIARSRYRRTVYEHWGYDRKMTTSRGLTAMFYGAPGTGKTMVAGVIARELGLDMYRVDLARVVSKWVGETEKNLAEVFDAAEDGQVLILFDEADSLFAKRTDVKSSNDRYANLEVNYLLQRLDSFEGIAILTSNLDGAIDPAFKRRLSLRLQFPFPDEEVRLRLWATHVTPQTPTDGDFDFGELARKFPLSGGYIRNCAVRAAFLAAHEGIPLAQKHLLRAIHLEYRELGKLSTSSRME
ncbi:MAG: ATP-binding protein, partial [Proteobacteria bacterium]|nr:ATP-binding protein [Pseudomonadota bacterium]